MEEDHEGIDAPTGSAWELRVCPGADPVSGKQRYATKTVRGGKREVQRLLNEMKVDAEGGLATRTTATVGELLDRWLELAREDLSPRTTREIVGYIERNLRPALGDVRLSELTTASFDRYYRSLLIDGGRRGRPLAPGTIRRTTSRRPSRTVGISPRLTRSSADVREIPSMIPACATVTVRRSTPDSPASSRLRPMHTHSSRSPSS